MEQQRRIKDIISKPSEALEAMVKGVRNQDRRKGFKVDLNSYGHAEEGICLGCLATCTIQQVTKKTFKKCKILLIQKVEVVFYL